MGKFEEIANQFVTYKTKIAWLQIEKFYNEIANKNDVSMAMAFVLLAINKEKGTTVTRIAPRIGMEPNSLSRTLKSMIENGYIIKKSSKLDKRKVFIHLTTLGEEKQNFALQNIYNLENSIKTTITEKELDTFFNVLNKMGKVINELKK